MTKLEQLIKKFCPKGTKFVKVGDVVKNISSGLNPRQNFKLNDSGATNWYVTVKEITKGCIVFSDKTDKITDEAVNIIQKRSKLEKDDVLLSGIGTIGKVALVDIPTNNWNCSESVILLKPNKAKIVPKFLKYIFESERVQRIFLTNARGSTLKGIRHDDLCNLLIPLPPTEVQTEIVRILDKFTSVTAELTAELTLRKKQYEYYRDKLLTFKERERVVMLGEIGNFFHGLSGKTKDDFVSGNASFVPYMNVFSNPITNLNKLEKVNVSSNENQNSLKLNDVLFTVSSETPDEVGMSSVIGEEPYENIYLNSFCTGYRFNNPEKFYSKYLAHLFRSYSLRKQIEKCAFGVTRFNMSKDRMKKISLPLIDINEQKKIGDIIDNFYQLIGIINKGLPAEITLRHKQYEYYRNKLLTFEELRE